MELQIPLAAVLGKADTQLLRLAQMRQTRSLPFVQGLKVPIRHRTLHLNGNSAAVNSFAASDHDGKYGVHGVLTVMLAATLALIAIPFLEATESGASPGRNVEAARTIS